MADLILLHAPAQFDFTRRARLLGPISDVIPSSPVFEMYPVGFVALASYLDRHGFSVRIVNLAYMMLKKPDMDIDRFLARLKPRLAFGIDLHWLPHAYGALELARRLKRLHPRIPVVFGGLSSTYFHRELLEREHIDFVVRGDSTERPMLALLRSIEKGGGFGDVPNLTWRDGGSTVENPLTNVPDRLDEGLNEYPRFVLKSGLRFDLFKPTPFFGWWRYPIFAVLTCRGCTQNCVICGGSKWSYEFYAGRGRIAFQSPEVVARRAVWLARHFGGPIFLIGDLRQGGMEYAERLLKALGKARIKNHVVIELFWSADRSYFDLISKNIENYNIEFSPETHDDELRRLAGKPYTTADIVETIDAALASGVRKFDIFFMSGIPKQTAGSVLESIDFFKELYDRFDDDRRLNLFISPLAPFLDPGSIAFEKPDDYGYRILFKKLDGYVKALEAPCWPAMFNYESDAMNRDDLVDATYEAGRRLTELKRRRGYISNAEAERIIERIDSSRRTLEVLEADRFAHLPASEIMDILDREGRLAGAETVCASREIEWPISGRRFHFFRLALSALLRRYG